MPELTHEVVDLIIASALQQSDFQGVVRTIYGDGGTLVTEVTTPVDLSGDALGAVTRAGKCIASFIDLLIYRQIKDVPSTGLPEDYLSCIIPVSEFTLLYDCTKRTPSTQLKDKMVFVLELIDINIMHKVNGTELIVKIGLDKPAVAIKSI